MAAGAYSDGATATANGTSAASVNISSVPDDAWMIAILSGAGTIAAVPAGWETLLPISTQLVTGSRNHGIAVRKKQSGDTSIAWATTTSANKRLSVTWFTGVADKSSWTIGVFGVRNAANVVSGESVQAGTSTTSVCPSATSVTDGLVAHLAFEATTAVGTFAWTGGSVAAGFDSSEDTTYIERHLVGTTTPGAGATAASTATASQVQANNGFGVQIVMPPASTSITGAPAADTPTVSIDVPTSTWSGTVSGPGVVTGSPVADTPAVSVAVPTSSWAGTYTAPTIKSGFTSVAQFLARPGATAAWRLGGGPYPQHSEYAADRSLELGYPALEFSCGFTSDWATVGPFGHGPQYLDSIVGGSGNIDPGSMTFATMQATYQNRTNPVSPGVYQPFFLLSDAIAKYSATHLLIVDPKYGFDHAGKVTKLLDMLDAAGGPTKFLLKFDSPANACQLTIQGHARGYTVINYWGTDTTSLAAQQSNWDVIGMSYLASSGNWITAKSYGKKVWAAVVPDQAAYDSAWAASGGFDFANVSGVTSVAPVGPEPILDATTPAVSIAVPTSAWSGTVTAPVFTGTQTADTPAITIDVPTSSWSGAAAPPSFAGAIAADTPAVTVAAATSTWTGAVTAPAFTGSLAAETPGVTASVPDSTWAGSFADPGAFVGTMAADTPTVAIAAPTVDWAGTSITPTFAGSIIASSPAVGISTPACAWSGTVSTEADAAAYLGDLPVTLRLADVPVFLA